MKGKGMKRVSSRRVFYILVLCLLIGAGAMLQSCGGGGAGSSTDPKGNSPGVPHTLLLFPDKTVAQTGTYVELHAKLMDGNGNPIVGDTVNFTNKSIVGTLYTMDATPTTTAKTDSRGIASVRIRSTTPGFASVVAESHALRDFRTIYFTTSDIISGISFNPLSLLLEVDGDNDGIYDETSDFNLFETTGDDTVTVRATLTLFGEALSGYSITFTADNPDAFFPDGTDLDGDGKGDLKTSTTDSFGQAYATVKVEPSTTFSTSVVMNIQAITGLIYVPEFDQYFTAASLVSLFLEPVVIDQIDLYANPTIVNVDDTSDLTIGVRLNTGGPAPDGTSVQLTASCGSIDTPFVQTKDGNATATFTAPSTPGSCTVTATAGGVSDSVTIQVNSDLQISGPSSISEVSGTATFSVTGGTGPYTITFSNGSGSGNPIFNETSPVNGDTLTLTTDSACDKITQNTTATVTVTDSVGASDTINLTVTNNLVTPLSGSVCENDGTCSAGTNTITFTFCGVTPYDVTSDNTSIIADQTGLNTATFDVTPNPNSETSDTDVTLTVTDNNSDTDTVTVTVVNQ
jgi:hypothetical protein